VSEEYGFPDAEGSETTRGSKNGPVSNHEGRYGRNEEDDTYERQNPALFVIERYCKPVTTGGRGARRTRLQRGVEGENTMQVGGRCGTRHDECHTPKQKIKKLTGFSSAGYRPACRDHQHRSIQPNHVWISSGTPSTYPGFQNTFAVLGGQNASRKPLDEGKWRGEGPVSNGSSLGRNGRSFRIYEQRSVSPRLPRSNLINVVTIISHETPALDQPLQLMPCNKMRAVDGRKKRKYIRIRCFRHR
jgi:hypothetical protein